MRKRLRDLKPDDVVLVGQVDLSNEAEVAGNLDVRHLANGPGKEPDGVTREPTKVFWRGDGAWRPSNDGTAEGRSGNFFYPILAGPPVVCPKPPAELRVFRILKRSRHYRNPFRVARARLQVDTWVAGPAGLQLHLVYFDAFDVPHETGVFVRLDRVNFPEPGAFLPLVAAAKSDNTLLGLALKGGNGTGEAQFNNVWFEGTESDTPPNSPPGDPPFVGLFDGLWLSDMGTFIDDARTLIANDDGNDVGGWENQVTGSPVQGVTPAIAPQYDTDVEQAGFPSVRFPGDPVGATMFFDELFAGTEQATLYIVLQKARQIGEGALWNMGGTPGETTLYPDADNHVRDSALSNLAKTAAALTPIVTVPHVYSVRSKNGQWSNRINNTFLYSTSANTYQAGVNNDGSLGRSGNADNFEGSVWLLGMSTKWHTDEEWQARMDAIYTRYSIAP